MSEQTQVATTEAEQQEAPRYELQRVTRQELMMRAEQTPPAQMRTFGELHMMAGHVARTGILGTQDPDQVLTLMLMAQAEGRDCMAVKGRWWIWSQGGKIHTQRNAKSVLADFHRAGGQTQILRDTAEEVTIRFLYRGRDYTCTWNDGTVKAAGLNGRETHRSYPRIMKFHRCVTEGVGKIAPEVLDGAVAVGETVIDIDAGDQPPPKQGEGQRAAQRPTIDVSAEVRRAASTNKRRWHPDGKPTASDFAPAWLWLSLRLGREVSGPDDITESDLDEVRAVFALGAAEVALRLADDSAQGEQGDVIEGEVIEDDPFAMDG